MEVAMATSRRQSGSGPRETVGGSLLGRRGEDLAAGYLVDLGYEILARNWRCRSGEIDLIAGDLQHGRRTIIFCEVKTRAGLGFGDPLESITFAKRRRLRRLAGQWLIETGVHAENVRIDAIGVVVRPGEEPRINHVRGIDA
jgi:putative endonuclease